MARTIDQVLDQSGILYREVLADPYPTYHTLREENPVHWSNILGTWILTRYADVAVALRHPKLSSKRTASLGQLPEVDEDEWRFSHLSQLTMGWSDPPDHTRLRKLMNKAFTPALVASRRPRIEEIVSGLLDPIRDSNEMDVIRQLASPLPVIVISEIIGVPSQDRELFEKLTDEVQTIFATARITPERAENAQRAITQLMDYFTDFVSHRRRYPRDDLTSALIAAEEHGEFLSEEELLINTVMLLFAGHETTTSLIGNGTLALLRHPGQFRRLRDNPSLISSALEELLRYDSPLHRSERVAAEDLELGGQPIARGQRVWSMIGAANRDPAQFEAPDRLDLARQSNKHVAFGYGIHFCLGAPLARLEGEVVFAALARRFPSLELATDEIQWQQNMSIRCLTSLRATF